MQQSFPLPRRFLNAHKCVHSKTALVVLLWCFVLSMAIGVPKITLESEFMEYIYQDPYYLFSYSIMIVPYLFYPLIGLLTDVRFNRFKVIICSLYLLVLSLALVGVLLWMIYMISKYTSLTRLVLGFKVLTALNVLLVVAGVAGFHSNIIQFGMDQLHDSPSDHQSLFIHWYVWCWQLGGLLFAVLFKTFLSTMTLIFFTVLVALFQVCISHCSKDWFVIDATTFKPYRLLYRVTRFTRRHKVPIRRSAFTYCEDEIPCGLDLGKHKYGGPFTTEQVEDVKAFYGILRVLLALGPVFFLDISTGAMLFKISRKVRFNHNVALEYLVGEGLLSRFLTVVCIPVYICLVRPFVFNYIPGMLKRIGLGVLLMLASCGCTLVMLTVAHVEQEEVFGCMFDQLGSNASVLLFPSQYAPYAQCCLASLFTVLLYPALYEFICSQSPHAMKGLLLGLCFAIKGLFEFVGLITVLLFTIFAKKQVLPSCGMEYYILNVAVGVVALVVYSCIARRYKYRVRDEPCHVHRFVEEYYSKLLEDTLYR